MKPGKIRPIAIGIFRHNDAILVAEGYDSIKGQTFYRPLGGTIEFGERSDQTVMREIREELGAKITSLRYLGTIENIFTYNGETGHEIVLIYEGEFADQALYNMAVVSAQEDDGSPFKAVWKSLRDFQHGEAPLYPSGLMELLIEKG